MKRCPECRRDYYDDTLSYCLDDGSALLEGPASLDEPATDEPATAILSERTAGEHPTRHLKPSEIRSPIVAYSRNSIIVGVIGIAVITTLGLGSYLYYGRNTSKQIESIAVMPFVNESGSADVEYLSDGMTETLINTLSQIPDLSVKARSSVFPYKGKEVDAATIGSALKVQGVLNGRVVQRGDELTLFLSLEDTQTNNRIWGKQYNRNITNLLALQSDIARDVSERLKPKLTGTDEQKLSKNSTENAEAYQLYLKGRFHWYKRTEKDFQKAAEYFRQAIALDPGYARAYAGLADLHASGGAFRQDPALRLEQLAKAREAALKAVSLDDNLAEAHTALGTILASADYDFVGAEREYRRAIDLNPNYADAHYWYGMILNRLGRWEESFAEFQKALELEPFNLLYRALYGASLTWARRYDDGINYLEKTRELDENFLPTLGNLTTAYELNGKYDKAIEVRARELELTGFAQDAAAIRRVHAKGGWVGYLRYVTSSSRPAWVTSYGVAIAHIGLDERNKAIAALNKSYEDREGQAQRLKVDPRLDVLRDDPRYQELLKKVGFPE